MCFKVNWDHILEDSLDGYQEILERGVHTIHTFVPYSYGLGQIFDQELRSFSKEFLTYSWHKQFVIKYLGRHIIFVEVYVVCYVCSRLVYFVKLNSITL